MRFLRQHTTSAVLLTAIVAFSATHAGVAVVQNSARKLVISWELSEYDLQEHGTDGQKHTIITSSEHNLNFYTESGAIIPSFSFMIGVPWEGEIHAALEPISIERHAIFPLEPTGDEPPSSQPRFQRDFVSEPRYGQTSGFRTAEFAIRPFKYDPLSGELKVLRQGRITITFPQVPSRAAQPAHSRFERMLSRMLLNYDIAVQWKKTAPSGMAKTHEAHPLRNQKAIRFDIGDGNSGINEGTNYRNRLIRIDHADIEVLAGTIPIANVALYGSHKGEMPERADSSVSNGVTEIPVLRFDLDNDGIMDASDYLIAYVTENSDWKPSWERPENPKYTYNLNRYDDFRHYWIVLKQGSAQTIDTLDGAVGSGIPAEYFTDHRLFKSPQKLPWGWEGGSERSWRTITVANPYFNYKMDLVGVLDSSAEGTVEFNGFKPTPHPHISSARVRIDFDDGVGEICDNCQTGSRYLVDGFGKRATSSALRFKAEGAGQAQYDIRDFTVTYRRKLVMGNEQNLTIFSPFDSATSVTYQLADVLDTSLLIIRLSPDESEMKLITPKYDNGTARWTDSAGKGYRYFVSYEKNVQAFPQASLHLPPSNTSWVIRDLRSPSYTGVNYLIVTDSAFIGAAEALAKHKRSFGVFESPVPRIVFMQDIYRLFGGGNTDPAALRNFLSFAYHNWTVDERPGLEYVVLMGNGHWDYKHTNYTEPIRVPTFQTGSGTSQKCVDDYFACLDHGETHTGKADIFLGRLPCDSPEEAMDIVAKIRATEDASLADFGGWRDRILLVADDDRQGSGADKIRDHHVSSEAIKDIVRESAPSTDIRKVYLFEYESDEFYEKPEATRAIANEINNGVACVNYFGHGDAVLWADEHILAIDNMGVLRNAPRYPVVCSFSCSVGKFDRPEQNALTDALVKFRNAGAVAGIASSRLAYATSNTYLAKHFFTAYYNRDTVRSLGEAYCESMTNFSSNKQYVLLGDPSLQMINPSRTLDLQITDTTGLELDSIMSLQQIIIKGAVLTKEGALDKGYGTTTNPAYVQIGMFNAPDTSQRKDGRTEYIAPYTLPGIPLFSGQFPVSSGVFEQRLRVPPRLTFDREGPKVTAFAWQEGRNALGHKKVIFHGSVQDSIKDTLGPAISIRPLYKDASRNAMVFFDEKITVALPVEIEIGIHDESGIDVVGVGPDEGLTMEISDGALSKRNINHKFRFAEGDFRKGTAVVALDEGAIDAGDYMMKVSALDLFGNATEKEFEIGINEEAEFRLGMVFNYPNPMKMGETTRFFFYTSSPTYPWQTDNVRVLIKIYTLSGKLVRVLETSDPAGIQNGVVWDGRDQVNQVLSPNVYLYQVIAHRSDTQLSTSKSEIRKLVIHPPR